MRDQRQMTMIAFMQAQNCSNYVGSWRHPASQSDFLTPQYFQRMARILEDGKFHLAFFDDRLAMPDRYKNDHVESVEGGVRVIKMDVITIMTVMGLATSRLGIGGTGSTTYFEPFHIARAWATLDQPRQGGDRAGLLCLRRRNPHDRRGEVPTRRQPGAADRYAVAALRSHQLRFRLEADGRAVHRRRDGEALRHARHARPGDPGLS